MAHDNSLGATNARHHQLQQILRSPLPAESECQRFLSRFDTYVAAQLAGENYLTLYPDIAMHLDRCPVCADTYARLYELEVALATDALPAPENIPTPDLSFLSGPQVKPAQSLVDLWADILTTTANSIHLQLNEALLALLQPHAPAPLTRAADDDARYGEVLYELQAEQLPATPLPIKLTAYRDTLHPQQCLLEVIVMPPAISWPNLGGYTVTLTLGQDAVTKTTDAWGLAAFVDIPISRLSEVALQVERAP